MGKSQKNSDFIHARAVEQAVKPHGTSSRRLDRSELRRVVGTPGGRSGRSRYGHRVVAQLWSGSGDPKTSGGENNQHLPPLVWERG